MSNIIRITKDLSFSDAKNLSKKEVIKIQFREWIFNPARKLCQTGCTDDHMAALIILLTFFEPHGQYLTGIDSNSKSKTTFIKAFNEFKNYAKLDDHLGCIEFYKFARCGLFHSLTMKNTILVDSINSNGKKIVRKLNNQWIVNVPNFLNALVEYHLNFLNNVDENDEKLTNTFNRLLGDHLQNS